MLFCGLLFIWSLFSLTELELVFNSVLFPGLLSVCGLFEVEEVLFCLLRSIEVFSVFGFSLIDDGFMSLSVLSAEIFLEFSIKDGLVVECFSDSFDLYFSELSTSEECIELLIDEIEDGLICSDLYGLLFEPVISVAMIIELLPFSLFLFEGLLVSSSFLSLLEDEINPESEICSILLLALSEAFLSLAFSSEEFLSLSL